MAKIVFEANSCKFKLQLLKIEIQVHKQKLQQICDTVQKESINLDLKHKSYKQYEIRTILFLKQKRKKTKRVNVPNRERFKTNQRLSI